MTPTCFLNAAELTEVMNTDDDISLSPPRALFFVDEELFIFFDEEIFGGGAEKPAEIPAPSKPALFKPAPFIRFMAAMFT